MECLDRFTIRHWFCLTEHTVLVRCFCWAIIVECQVLPSTRYEYGGVVSMFHFVVSRFHVSTCLVSCFECSVPSIPRWFVPFDTGSIPRLLSTGYVHVRGLSLSSCVWIIFRNLAVAHEIASQPQSLCISKMPNVLRSVTEVKGDCCAAVRCRRPCMSGLLPSVHTTVLFYCLTYRTHFARSRAVSHRL